MRGLVNMRIAKYKIVNLLLGIILSFLFVLIMGRYMSFAKEQIVLHLGNFWEEMEGEDSFYLWGGSEGLDANKNRIIVIDYVGPKWEKINKMGCLCDNEFWFKVTLAHVNQYNANWKNEPIYISERFNWKNSYRAIYYLPSIEWEYKNALAPLYNIYLGANRLNSIDECPYDEKDNYGRRKYNDDCLDFSLTIYDITEIGIARQNLKIGEKTFAKFTCDDYIGQARWRSDNISVVSVDEYGTVVANNSGEAMLILSIDGQDVFSQKITVGSVGKPRDMELYENDTQQIEISGIDGEIKWESSDDSIAVVSDGYVKAKKIGETSITGTCNGFKTTFKVTVSGRKLSSSQISLYSGEDTTLSLSGSSAKAEWSSDNKKVAVVEDGKIIALKPGSTIIKAKIGSQVLECKVEVLESQLSFQTLDVLLGDDIPLEIIGSSQKPVIVSSNDDVVAIKKGKCVAVGTGKATISCTLGDETLECKIKVSKKAAPTGLCYEASSKVIKLKWNEYSGAKSFSVYLYNEEAKEYKLIDTVKKASYTAKDLVPGKTYIFKVAANVKINGSLMEQSLSEKIKCKTAKKDIVGWQTVDGKKYYYKDGFPVGEGIRKIDGNKYIFDDAGVLVTEKVTTIEGAKYYSDSSGKVAISKEITDKENSITYVADKDGVLTKKKSSISDKTTKTSTKTVTFNDITLEIPTSWGSVTKDGDSYSYSFGSSMFMIYTDPKNGSLTQKKADYLVAEFEYVCCDLLDITKSKEYSSKKLGTYYVYAMNLSIPDYSGYGSTSCKGRLTAFEHNGKYYVAVMFIEKSKCKDDSFDEYTDVIKSIKTKSGSSGGTKKNSGSGSGKNSGTNYSRTVYVTETGACYHYINPCGNGKYYETTLEAAIRAGYQPCDKCVH